MDPKGVILAQIGSEGGFICLPAPARPIGFPAHPLITVGLWNSWKIAIYYIDYGDLSIMLIMGIIVGIVRFV